MSIPTIVTTTIPTIPSMPPMPSVPPMPSATSVGSGVNSVISAVNSLPPAPSMNTVSNITSDVKDAGIKTLSFMDKIMRDMKKIFSFKGMYNLSSLMLNILIVVILINLMSSKTLTPMYTTALYILIISSILFYMISYVFDDEVVKDEHTHENKSNLSTQPIVVK